MSLKKVLLQDLKKCKHWFSYRLKTILNDYTKEICAKQVANQSDFLKAFLHLEPLLYYKGSRKMLFRLKYEFVTKGIKAFKIVF